LSDKAEIRLQEYYRNEVTSATFEELKITLRWFNDILGNFPFVIGGWAVWAYTKGLGSRDMDIVMPLRESVDPIMVPFYRANGYEKKGGPLDFGKYFAKSIEVNGGQEEFYLDICSYQDHNYFHEDRDKEFELPWDLLEKHHELGGFEGLKAYIPTKELLVLSKVKAYRDRKHDLKHRGAHESDLYRMQSKIWKDAHDIRELMKLGIDFIAFAGIIREANLDELEARIWNTLNELETIKPEERYKAQFAGVLAEVEACLPKDPATGDFAAFGPESIAVKEAIKRSYLTRQQAVCAPTGNTRTGPVLLGQTEFMALKPEEPSGLDAEGRPLERSDVVHDLLAHLAERMMELHKAKQAALKEVHTWLELRTGLPVADWKLKTMVQKFHEKSEHDWKRALRDRANRKRFRLNTAGAGGSGGNGGAGGGGEVGWGAFEAEALGRLRAATEGRQPTLERIEATDWLIDQIVYRLYGLTDDEVAIVEGRQQSQ